MDGLPTERSKMSSRLAGWFADDRNAAAWECRPVRGDIGILVVSETQLFNHAQQGSPAYHVDSVNGVYRAFFGSNIQADPIRVEQISRYEVVYLPFPVMLSQATADVLIAWVENGGTPVSEG